MLGEVKPMECLEIEPPENKKLVVYLLQKEYEEEWSFNKTKPSPLKTVYSKDYCEFIKKVVDEHQPDFVAEELGLHPEEEYLGKNQLSKHLGLQVIPIDIPEGVRDYIESAVEPKIALLNQIKSRLKVLYELNFEQVENEWEQRILAWGRYLEEEIRREEEKVKTSVREAWMVKKILDYARNIGKNEVKCAFVCSLYHFKGLAKLFDRYGVEVYPIKLERSFKVKSDNVGTLEPIEVEFKTLLQHDGGGEIFGGRV